MFGEYTAASRSRKGQLAKNEMINGVLVGCLGMIWYGDNGSSQGNRDEHGNSGLAIGRRQSSWHALRT